MNVVTGSNQADTAEEKLHECKCSGKGKEGEYKALIKQLEDKVNGQEEIITALNETIKKYENMPVTKDIHEFNMLLDQRDKLQEENNTLIQKLYNQDYIVDEQKKVIENLNKTLKRYEKENKAFRELIALWI